MHILELIQGTMERPHKLSLHMERIQPHLSDGPLLRFLLVHGIHQMQNLHHCDDNVQVDGEAPLVDSKRGQRGSYFTTWVCLAESMTVHY